MFLTLYQLIKKYSPRVKGLAFKLLFSSKRISIGKNFRCDTWPSVIIDINAKLIIGDQVTLRRNVEIRAHGYSTIHLKGNNRIDRGVRILGNNNAKISIGINTRIGLYTVLNGGDSISIGKKVLISGFVYLQTSMHNHNKNRNIQDQGYKHGPIEIHDDVWLGSHVVVLPNCVLSKGCVVGSNAVVTKSAEKESVLAGVPAKIIKERS